MCGISGIWRLDGSPVDPLSIEGATNVQRHRGPDDEGYLLVNTLTSDVSPRVGDDSDPRLALPHVKHAPRSFNLAFGFRRLSIQDLSEAGHQPMAGPERRFWIVFNGEIYNYIELRAELAALGYRFHTGSDTEVILAAYDRWGTDCPTRFNGMWALALWDSVTKTVFISRDRFGEKPLHYVHIPQKVFAFSSEIKVLRALRIVDDRLHEQTLQRFLHFEETDSGEQTFYDQIMRLPQAHSAVVGADGLMRKWRYWDITPGPASADSPAQLTQQFRDLFTDSVRIRLRADVPVGSSLSGGLDSSTIVCVMNSLLPAGAVQKTFSARFDDTALDEGKWIRYITDAARVEAHATFPTGEQLRGDLSRLFWHQEEPFESTSIYAQWSVMKLAKQQGVTVLLDGQGADEILAGYHTYFDDVAYGLLREGNILGYLHWRRMCARDHGRPTGLLRPLVRQAVPAPLKAFLKRSLGVGSQLGDLTPTLPIYPAEWSRMSSLRKKLWWNTTRLGLNKLLRYADRNSMAHSREVRLPFLDYRLVEFVFTLPDTMLLRGRTTKWVLREAYPDLVPQPTRERRDKVGYQTPEAQWIEGRVWKNVMREELEQSIGTGVSLTAVETVGAV